MERQEYQNPPEEINSRIYENIDAVSEYVIETLFKEVSGTNIGAYCASHHSIETRSTKIRHLKCQLIDGTTLRGTVCLI